MKFELAGSADTIFAPATAQAKSALAIVRVSGPCTQNVVMKLCRKAPEPRIATLVKIVSSDDVPIDQGILIYFPASCSPTGEDAAEFHLHGNPHIVDALSGELILHGLRFALPGEFTRRSVMAGRMDLTEAEGLADLLDAETVEQRRQAIFQLYGSTSDIISLWRDELLEALSLIEAEIDFSDEGDVQNKSLQYRAIGTAKSVKRLIQATLQNTGVGERIRDGFRVVIAGPTNAGKSTLLNHLAGREVAIVSDVPGTTRDAIEVRLDLCGIPVRLLDTAGLRPTEDIIEGMGIAKSRQEMVNADCILWLSNLHDHAGAEIDTDIPIDGSCVIRVGTHADLLTDPSFGDALSMDVAISAKTGHGIDQLLEILIRVLGIPRRSEHVIVTRARHREGLNSTVLALDMLPEADAELDVSESLVLWAEDLRSAIFHLGTLTGHTSHEAVLDKIFASFCIGK